MSAIQAAKNLLALDQQEELEDLPKDDPLSTSEEEGASEGERKHQKLLEAVISLDRKNGWKLPERSEASLKVSEFNVSSEGSGEKLVLSDLFESIKAPSSLATVKRQLNRVKSKKIVELPRSEEEAERIHREVAFSQTSRALSKWEPVVLKNRRAKQLVFPLNQESAAFAPLEHVFSGWKARTPLEQEIFNLLHKNKQPVAEPLLTPVEKAILEAMSLEEAKMRRSELQKARALQSYYEARARRERKIKSKKYHKVLKKEKAKTSLKEFEALQKVHPNAALGLLEKIESTRMMERMSLRHQNTGKWARSKAIMAQYHLETRQAKQEQLARNKELIQKLRATSESEEEREGGERLVPDAVNEVPMDGHAPNPWILGSLSGDTREEKTQKPPEQLSETAAPKASESKEAGESVAEEILLKEFEERQSLRKMSGLSQDAELGGSQEAKDFSSWELLSKLRTLPPKLNKEHHPSGKQQKKMKEQVIDLQKLLTVDSSRRSPAAPTTAEGTGGEEDSQKQMIEEAFAGDDVIGDFFKEKREAVEAGKPKDTDLTLPGWGEWGGVCPKPSAQKRHRFLIKAPEGPPRKDKDLPNVIINENRNIQAAAHRVRVLPYPFAYCQQFERTLQTPTGCMWNTQRAFQSLTAPTVVTKPGHIIAPMRAEDVGYRPSSGLDLSVTRRNPKPLPVQHRNN
ncbi:U3 small nucleolar RNA-associated protein 14 homolog A-like [Talpa occidentalis]|uniref:U3 small nucleolar RNA-associated protein 14 homolog A-like n=1 Tax=Talpa occidentalis TaxID=50954 RepID=UPI0023FA2E89|nr:U3 small nucleolar RNA-associated protein 14 homolog A-like [Talpa occidentalis]